MIDAATLAAVLNTVDEYAKSIAETEDKERANVQYEKTNRARILEGKALAVQTIRTRLEGLK